MAEPICHYCDRPAEEECPACGRLYCAEHGEDVCLRCLAPESAAPSAAVYRGSVVALVVATLVTIFLVVRPPASKGQADTVRTVATATPSFSATATPTPTARPGATTGATASAAASASPAASATAAPGAPQTYTVKAGDTLSGIAAQFHTTEDAIIALNPGLDPGALQIGAVLQIPAAQ